jgi:predicted RNA binding protein YcfA (HicA-like mRNA interferase family)
MKSAYLLRLVVIHENRGGMMTRAEKRLHSMEANPNADWRYDEVAALLRAFGFSEKKGATSHRRWTHPTAGAVTIVAASPVSAYQVRQAVERIRASMEDQ